MDKTTSELLNSGTQGCYKKISDGCFMCETTVCRKYHPPESDQHNLAARTSSNRVSQNGISPERAPAIMEHLCSEESKVCRAGEASSVNNTLRYTSKITQDLNKCLPSSPRNGSHSVFEGMTPVSLSTFEGVVHDVQEDAGSTWGLSREHKPGCRSFPHRNAVTDIVVSSEDPARDTDLDIRFCGLAANRVTSDLVDDEVFTRSSKRTHKYSSPSMRISLKKLLARLRPQSPPTRDCPCEPAQNGPCQVLHLPPEGGTSQDYHPISVDSPRSPVNTEERFTYITMPILTDTPTSSLNGGNAIGN
ncbi:hypothetical protein LSH36_24g01013 [Paralvinella palmiformis]|uniref:Uncharacterized protein n=1 Tax=Paralvinella palmiformis TaxID=53620 RepID=A0AAD9KC67_9ANNE|nr:hypothetical protein LSH36_24g01013 [Paralvinella palmiformis]